MSSLDGMIEVTNLQKTYPGRGGILKSDPVHAVKGVSFTIPSRGAAIFVGESGCGKTTIGRILSGLESFDAGDIVIHGSRLSAMRGVKRQQLLQKVQLIQQDPYAALNPARTVWQSLEAPLALMAKRHQRDKHWMYRRAQEVLWLVGLNPEVVLPKYPHMLSGGQRQRVVIARALTVEPQLLIADEAVSMIDVSLRLGILALLRRLREEAGIALLFITHDIAAARYVGHDGVMYVIYQGQIVESGPTENLIKSPVHPYTQALLSAVPVLQGIEEAGKDRYIPVNAFQSQAATGCAFHPRCRWAAGRCSAEPPVLVPWDESREHWHRCFYPTPRQVVAQRMEGIGDGR
ncbi:MAG: ABC transporter ATP-binding protein [Sulfobacillus sp.]|nr:ABC transporter ATP-binding protein [Sulfobacillus sp.]